MTRRQMFSEVDANLSRLEALEIVLLHLHGEDLPSATEALLHDLVDSHRRLWNDLGNFSEDAPDGEEAAQPQAEVSR